MLHEGSLRAAAPTATARERQKGCWSSSLKSGPGHDSLLHGLVVVALGVQKVAVLPADARQGGGVGLHTHKQAAWGAVGTSAGASSTQPRMMSW